MAAQVVRDISIDVSTEKCTDHDKTVEFSCQTCNGEMVCRICVLQGHNGHFLGDVQKFISKQRQDVFAVLHKADQHLEQLNSDMANVEERIQINDTESENLIAQIEERGKTLKHHIDEIVTNGVEKTKKYQNKNRRILKKVLRNITQSKLTLEEESNRCRDLVNSTRYEDIKTSLDVGQQLKKSISAEAATNSTKTRTFIVPPVSEDIGTLETLFGKLKIAASKVAAVSLTIKSSFYNTGKDAVFRICPVMDGDAAWVGGDECTLSLYTFEGEVLDTIELDTGVNDMCVMPQCNDLTTLVVACEDNTIRKIIPGMGEDGVHELFTIESDPQSISFTADGDILIVSAEHARPIKVSLSGNQKPLGSKNEMDWQLTRPNTIRVNDDSGDVVILNNEPGCMYALDENLSLKFKSTGQQFESEEDVLEFSPQSVTFDREGNILIADWGRRSVLLFDSEGHFLQTLITGQDEPQVVEMLQESATHVLWVGYNTGKVETYKYNYR